MTGILYPDAVAAAIAKLRPILTARSEPYTHNVRISGRKESGRAKHIVFSQGPENDFNTINTVFLRCSIYAPDMADAVDLTQMVRMIFTGGGAAIDGSPFVYGAMNAGPIDVDDATDMTHLYIVLELRLRGVSA